jgi:phosphatidylglycerophosphate synthase
VASSEPRSAVRIGKAYEAAGETPAGLTEGEWWTREQLERLRRDGYRPSAWAEFIRASMRRSADTRDARPALARQARRWEIAGAAAWVGACRVLRRRTGEQPGLSRGLLWWAGVGQMLEWHLGMAEGAEGVPRGRLSGADALTLARLWSVPLLREVRHSRVCLCSIILLGGLTDWLDGMLAGAEPTRLGRDLDTVADLCFFGAATRAVHRAGRLPGLAAGALLARYAIGVVLGVSLTFRAAGRPAATTRRWGAPLRVGGLALAAAGARRSGGALCVLGCAAIPRELQVAGPQLEV